MPCSGKLLGWSDEPHMSWHRVEQFSGANFEGKYFIFDLESCISGDFSFQISKNMQSEWTGRFAQ